MPATLRLSPKDKERLNNPAAKTGRFKAFYLREAIEAHFGSKANRARSVAGPANSNCLLVGEAPGNAAAARELGCSFKLIRPGDEEAAWLELMRRFE